MKRLMDGTTTEVTEQVISDVLTGTGSKSGKMKELFNLGLEIKQIAVLMNVRYNFVYNVVQNMVIVDGIQVETNRGSSKKDEVWKLLDLGKTTKEIAIELKTNYNYVYKLKKDWVEQISKEVEMEKEKEQKVSKKKQA